VFAVSHAATALPLKRAFPRAHLWSLLLAVQAIELLWVVFTYTGVEHIVVTGGRVHLGFLAYSHSVGSTLALAAIAAAVIRVASRDSRLALAVAIGIVSHVVLDIIQHEPNIRLLPADWGPRLGFGLTLHPTANAVVEMVYGILCWWLFGGGWALVGGLVLLNALDWPFLVPSADGTELIARHPAILTTVVVIQIVVSWVVVWAFSRRRSAELASIYGA
jgi:hypothetical protein